MRQFLDLQASRPPDNYYLGGEIVSWNTQVDGFQATTGLIQPGVSEQFDIPNGGEKVRLVEPEVEEVIDFDILDPSGRIISSTRLKKSGEIFVPEGKDRLITPLGQRAVRYLCVYPGRLV